MDEKLKLLKKFFGYDKYGERLMEVIKERKEKTGNDIYRP